MSKQAMIAINASASRHVNYDTREDADNHTTIFLHLALHRQGILALVAGLASSLFELFTSVCSFIFGTEEDVCSLPSLTRSLAGLEDPLAFPTFLHDLSVSRCRLMKKTTRFSS